MDEDPVIPVPVGFLRLVSGDGFSFTVDEEYAKISAVLKTMLQSSFKESRTRIVHLPHVKGRVLEKVCQYFYYVPRFRRRQALAASSSNKGTDSSSALDSFTDTFEIPLELCKEIFWCARMQLALKPKVLQTEPVGRNRIGAPEKSLLVILSASLEDMEGTEHSKDVFNMPSGPRSHCGGEMSHSMKTPSSRAGSKRKAKPRAKSRGKSTSQWASSSGHSSKDPIDNSNTTMDADLNDMSSELDGVEQRVTEILNSLQKKITASATFMFDCIMAGIGECVDGVRSKIPEIQKRRQANLAAMSSLRALDGIDRA